ncbi:hypothetical protein JTE90_027010 [Oedothorax gibbosus]|uniref:Ionotropic glutamate receptor L-glutamate and glycine-binding domain-containing protein n=1 Tax=Oedothorax gibbosus TaxID=931172 RepID=A0AAV6VAD6_9ARAC|nr:hypothetical protein JTE90_027010 [Oedothorax gibbosus]
MKFPESLRIAVKPLHQLIELEESGHGSLRLKSGVDANLIKDLSQRMGFNYEIYTPEDGEWGTRKSDGNWTGTLGMLDRGEVDMAVSSLIITEERFNGFTFIPYSTFQFGFVTNRPQFGRPSPKFASPFQMEVWIACLVSFAIVVHMLWITSTKSSSIGRALMTTLGIFLNQDSTTESSLSAEKNFRERNSSDNKYVRGRISPETLSCDISPSSYRAIRGRSVFANNAIQGCWMVATMFLTYSYSAVLLSNLTLPVQDEGIRTVEELSDAILNHGYKFLYPEGSATPELISRNSKLQDVAEKLTKNKWTFKLDNGGHPQKFDTKSAVFGPKIVLQMNYGVQLSTTKVMSSDTIAVVSVGLAVGKHFCCTRKLQRYLNLVVESGLYSEYIQRTQYKTSYELAIDLEDNKTTPLSINDLYYTFMFVAVSMGVSFLVLLMEILSRIPAFKNKKPSFS